jgi:riboflavin synthase
MFTGLIIAQGRIIEIRADAGEHTLRVMPLSEHFPLEIGASIACHGICLTVTQIHADRSFEVQLSSETLRLTNAGYWQVGTHINLEPSLRVGDRLGGHFVSGHVDGLGEAILAQPDNESVVWGFRAPPALMRFIAAKGSIVVDGVSLTVNRIEGDDFYVNIIPHTQLHTHFGTLKVGHKVNLEIDMLARYTARILEVTQQEGRA